MEWNRSSQLAKTWLLPTLRLRMTSPGVDVHVTCATDHEGLAFSRRHELYPLGLVTLAFHVQVAKRADVVDLNVYR